MFVPHLSPILGHKCSISGWGSEVWHLIWCPIRCPMSSPGAPGSCSGSFWGGMDKPGKPLSLDQLWSGSLDDPHESHDKTKKTQSNTRSILMILLLDLRDLCFFLFLCFRFFSFYLILLVQNSCVSSLLVRSPHCLPRSNQITQQLSYTREAEGSWGSKLSENTQHLIIGHATRTIFIAGLMWLVMSIKM